MICERCKQRETSEIRLYGPPTLCRQCREGCVTPCSLGPADVRLAQSHIPLRFHTICRETREFQAIERMVDSAWTSDRGLLLEGPVGAGKTLAAAALAHRLLERGASVLFVNAVEVSDSLRKQQSPVTVEQMRVVQHLIIDDMGAEFDKSGWWFSILYDITNHRYETLRPTTVTCNQFRQIEPRILRRVSETARVFSLERK